VEDNSPVHVLLVSGFSLGAPLFAASAMFAALSRTRALAMAPVRRLRILAADPVDASCGATFADAGHKLTEKKMKEAELLLAIPQYEGLVVRSGVKVTAEIIAAGKKLRIIGRAGAGVDNVDLAAATRAGVLVMNTPGGNTAAAAELTMSLLMNMARSIPAASAALKVRGRERARSTRAIAPDPPPRAPPPFTPPTHRHHRQDTLLAALVYLGYSILDRRLW